MNGQLICWAAIKLAAERKAGELLSNMDKSKGGRPSETSSTTTQVSIGDLGISKPQSSRWQRAAKVPEEAFAVGYN
jgi:hypothetical protein